MFAILSNIMHSFSHMKLSLHLGEWMYLFLTTTALWTCWSVEQTSSKAFLVLGTTSECVVQNDLTMQFHRVPKKGTKILREGIHDSKNYGWWNLAELVEEFIFLKRFALNVRVQFSSERTYLKLCCACNWLRTYHPKLTTHKCHFQSSIFKSVVQVFCSSILHGCNTLDKHRNAYVLIKYIF